MPSIIDQPRPDQPNFDYLYNKEYYSRLLYANHFQDKKLSYKILKGGCITPKGIELEQKSESTYYVHKTHRAVYVGKLFQAYGHFIVESMSLLWFLRTKEYLENFSECPLIYISMGDFKIAGSQKRILEILGVNCSKLEPVTEPSQYDELVVPDTCFWGSGEFFFYLFSQEYIDTFDQVRNFALANIRPVKSRKVYFSYSKYHVNRSIGEDKLEKYFASKGYEIIYHPEKLTFDEQLNILIQCESFASTVGSCSHNIVFLRDNTEVILIPRTYYLSPWQSVIDQVHKLRINYVDSSFSLFVGKSILGGPFLYFVSSNLRKFFHDDNTESIVSVSDFKKYLRVCFGYSITRAVAYADNPDVYKYYSSVAPDYFNKLFNESWLVRFRKWLKSYPFVRQFINKASHFLWRH